MNLSPFPSGYRASGVLLHVTSLPSPYGIGDVGPAAVAWVARLHARRFKHGVLETAWKNFSHGGRPDLRPAFEHFGHAEAHWLDDYALFCALKARHGRFTDTIPSAAGWESLRELTRASARAHPAMEVAS